MSEKRRNLLLRTVCFLLALLTLAAPLSGCKEEEIITTGRLFRTELSADPSSLDPQVAVDSAALAVICNIYEGLVRMDNTGKIVPGVAKEWKIEQEHTVYTFYLREDAKWSNEAAVTSADFYYAILRALDPNTRAPNASLMFGIRGAEEVYNGTGNYSELGVVMVSDTEIRFELKESDPEFLNKVAQPVFFPCNGPFFRDSAGAYGMESETTLCNGPFRFRKTNGWLHDAYLYLLKNQFYSGEVAVAPAAIQFNLEDTEDILLALVDGDAHIAPIPKELIAEVEAEEEVLLSVKEYGTMTAGLFFNSTDPLFENETLRLALLKAIPNSKFAEMATEDQTVAHGLIPSATVIAGKTYQNATDDFESIVIDTIEAKEKMQQALDALNLSSLDDVQILCIDTPENRQILNVFLTAWYQTFGFYLNMEPVEEKEYRKRIASGEFQIAYGTVTAPNNTPTAFLESVCKLVKMDSESTAAFLSNGTSTLESCRNAEAALTQSGLFYPLFEQFSYYAQRASLTGAELDPFSGILYFRSAERT